MPAAMNGAESLVRTLVEGGVEVCFTNPGTSEMHFVAALDRVEGMRCVLFLFEGGATGAADGYARMADKPASTLLHLGPGLANGLANLHNAKKARTPVVNIVGEHATYHREYNAPLTSDIEGLAWPMSSWVRTGMSAAEIGPDGAAAIAAARTAPGQVATQIQPPAQGPRRCRRSPSVPGRATMRSRRPWQRSGAVSRCSCISATGRCGTKAGSSPTGSPGRPARS
jgi:acetolactate synthase-1/2/3 large subunit